MELLFFACYEQELPEVDALALKHVVVTKKLYNKLSLNVHMFSINNQHYALDYITSIFNM
jgi:hypothetical protein